MTVFSTLVVTFALLAGGVFSPRCNEAAGYVGFFCGASAIYAAFAYLYKDVSPPPSPPLQSPLSLQPTPPYPFPPLCLLA